MRSYTSACRPLSRRRCCCTPLGRTVHRYSESSLGASCDRSVAPLIVTRWEPNRRSAKIASSPSLLDPLDWLQWLPPRGPSSSRRLLLPLQSCLHLPYSFNRIPKPIEYPPEPTSGNTVCRASTIQSRSVPALPCNLCQAKRLHLLLPPIERGPRPPGSTMKFRQQRSTRCHSPS